MAPDRSPVNGGAPTSLAIETDGLRKVFGRTVAVDHLTLTVPRGEVFGYLGPNGAGKTTSVKMLLGLVRPSAGQARLLGRPLGDLAARRAIGFLPEQFRFHEWLKAGEFLDFHGQLYGLPPAERRRRIPEVLALVGLEAQTHDRLRTFSKGMLQRVGLAQALINDPELVFLDEPTSALDPLGRRDVRDLIRTLKARGTTVFLNSHLLTEVEMVCDRVAFVHRGRVAHLSPIDELLNVDLVVDIAVGPYDPLMLRQVERLAGVAAAEAGQLSLVVAHRDDIPAIVDLLAAARVPIYAVTPRRRSLEDVFIAIVEGDAAAVRAAEPVAR
ncbi:MAG: ABC transporter ATP-binding protein [Chloroflexi bacterium]|nr:ABC transporter ATP-binding protein [Chloroflexota bacterium]